MLGRTMLTAFAGLAFAMTGGAFDASAGHDDDPSTNNMHPLGHDVLIADLVGQRTGNPDISTDLAFQGRMAVQGNWNGFRLLDISAPGNPREISFTRCNGDQGDVSVWQDIVVRSTNSPNPGGRMCDGQAVAPGFEGLHVFDISDRTDPVLVATVPLTNGSHTHTLVPDTANGRILIYNSTSGGAAQEIAIVEIPLDNPSAAAQIGAASLLPFPGIDDCHDISVFTADVNLAACAGDAEAVVFDITDKVAPVPLYSIVEDGSGVGDVAVGESGGWHSSSFSWDGEIILLGWEPGGGVQNQCEAADDPVKRTLFFYDAATGERVGFWTLPRTQENEPGFSNQNCTIHNYNTVPLRTGRRVVVMGNYQAGTSAVDFTDPSNPFEFTYTDPPAVEDPVIAAGAWSSYWYNHFIYETNIEEGLNVFRVSSRHTAAEIRLDRLNPQTQTFVVTPQGQGSEGIE